MTAEQLKKLVRTIEPVQKLLVIEERMFNASNICMDDFDKTYSIKSLYASVRSSYVAMRAMRDQIRYRVLSGK